MQDSFLDPELPKTEHEVISRMRVVNSEQVQLRKIVDSQISEADSPDAISASTRLQAVLDLKDRLQLQLTHIRAGRHIVSRLSATGRARQLLPDDAHKLST
jgi:hypothetical protein